MTARITAPHPGEALRDEFFSQGAEMHATTRK
jgi:hypothetical protein